MSLPWTINEEFAGGVQVIDCDGDPVMEWEDGGYRREAEFVVKAVNTYQAARELAVAVKELVDDSMERNGPQVSIEIRQAYRTFARLNTENALFPVSETHRTTEGK